MFLTGLIIGLMIGFLAGGFIGVFAMALMFVGSDRRDKKKQPPPSMSDWCSCQQTEADQKKAR